MESNPEHVQPIQPVQSPDPSAQSTTSRAPLMRPADLIRASWSLFKTHWKIFVCIAAVPAVLTLLGELLSYGDIAAFDVLGVIFSFAGGIVSVALVPALIDVIRKLRADATAKLNVKEEYLFGFSFFWSLILVGIIIGVVSFGSFALFIVPFIFVALYTCMYSYTLVIDGKRGYAALTESYTLTYGRLGEVFWRLVYLALIMIGITLICMGIGFVVGLIAGILGASSSFVVASIINAIAGLIIGPIGAIYTYLLYTSLKETRSTTPIDTTKFKKWLIAFTVVGIVVILVIIVLSFVFGSVLR